MQTFLGALGRSVRAAVELVLPRACGGCERPSVWWCEDCARQTDTITVTRLLPDGVTDCTSVGAYAGPGGAALVAYKERGAVALRGPLGRLLARAVDDALTGLVGLGWADEVGRVTLVPVPSRSAARRRRGHDAVAGLAEVAATALSGGACRTRTVRALRHTRRVRDQAGLDVASRAANLSGALAVRPGRAASAIGSADVLVVVDDVVTTGASLLEAVRALRAAVPDAVVTTATVVRAADAGPAALAVIGPAG